ncbi:probable polygalacturonase At3g15720 [Lotus japonicus]|uniref:probable polygalacturonase At3g15720 n=1 Tax=Lotus japonicus TaxID=34305 RepID=UPI0025854F43|nr:probable polygalacturonase At3g15720 [Lotus japonicus]
MKSLFTVLLMFIVATPSLYARLTPKEGSSFNVGFNIVNYGATGDGHTDDSEAFKRAWQDLCGATEGTPTLLISNGSFVLQPMLFKGPCKLTAINIQVDGTIVAPESVIDWKWPDSNRGAWIKFSGINDLVINGGGTFDGQGAPWWTRYNDPDYKPTALQFHNCNNSALSGLTHINSPRNHISIDSCNDFSISNIHIIAPEDSHNTDGIDISKSSNLLIENSKIETGDDCIAINSGSSFINITGVTCGPGHGISVGSLGRNGAYETVEEIHVKYSTFTGTTNGARIKTWMGGSGYARKITFEHIILIGARNPVIIDQQYHDYAISDLNSAVRVSDVTYYNFTGTSTSQDAITLNCDTNVGCIDIVLNDLNITFADGGETLASCNNAHGTFSSCYPSISCLSS